MQGKARMPEDASQILNWSGGNQEPSCSQAAHILDGENSAHVIQEVQAAHSA